MTNCQSALDQFELKWARDIVGMNGIDGTDVFLRFKCGEVRLITVEEAKLKWPTLLKTFYKKNPGFGAVLTDNEKSEPSKLRYRRKSMCATTSSLGNTGGGEEHANNERSTPNHSLAGLNEAPSIQSAVKLDGDADSGK